MPPPESTLLILLPILFFGLVAPDLFHRLKLPWVTSLIVAGTILGPNGFDVVASNDIVEFFGFLGFTFLMLMAGLETDVTLLKRARRKIATLALTNALVPFALGFLVTWIFTHDIWAALIVGTIFISTSVAIAVPSLQTFALRREDEPDVMIAAIVAEDILSLFVLAIVLQTYHPITDLPLPQYFVALIISVLFLKRIVPKLAKRFFVRAMEAGQSKHERELRFIIVLTMAVLIFFSFLGVHPIVAAFLVGLLMRDHVTSTDLKGKLHTLGYGLFVPVFFFIIGMKMDIAEFIAFDVRDTLIIALIVTFFIGKVGSGYLGGMMTGMTRRSAFFFGIASLPQLTTTLAATYAAASVGIIDATVVTAVTMLSIITTFASPYLMQKFSTKLGAHQVPEGSTSS